MKATVTSKGQITIPAAIREKLQIERGTVLIFDENAAYLKASKAPERGDMRKVIGIGRDALETGDRDELLDELRGPVALPPKDRRRR